MAVSGFKPGFRSGDDDVEARAERTFAAVRRAPFGSLVATDDNKRSTNPIPRLNRATPYLGTFQYS
jgi:hypothetical protein